MFQFDIEYMVCLDKHAYEWSHTSDWPRFFSLKFRPLVNIYNKIKDRKFDFSKKKLANGYFQSLGGVSQPTEKTKNTLHSNKTRFYL